MRKVATLIAAMSLAAAAHFEILYTPEVEVETREVTLTNFFSHPYDGKHLMKSGLAEDGSVLGLKDAFVVHKGKKSSLMSNLKKVTYSTEETKAPGYDIKVSNMKSMGDYAVVIVPHPYWEPAENLYIQQITKLFLAKVEPGEEWAERCAEGHTEIIPFTNPYNVTPGSLFRAKVVDNEGKPVEGALVEVEYLNYAIDMQKHTFSGKPTITNDKKGTATIVTDVNGIFSFIPPKEGYWGFAALSAGSDKTYKGKELEQDPVIWINVTE